MKLHPLPDADGFNSFALLCLNDKGRFVEPGEEVDSFTDGHEVAPEDLPSFLKKKVRLPDGVTDVFVWVHGWRNDHACALAAARRLFAAIGEARRTRPASYPNLTPFNPAFIAVRWPSLSSPLPAGYRLVRDRAASLTERGDAAFFLASLLGYLDQKNTRAGGPGSKTLAAADGFFVHCLGHSFGGRFLTAAIRAAATPQRRTLSLLQQVGKTQRKVLSATPTANGFQFTVDSILVFQMAAPRAGFGGRLKVLLEKAPLRGPLLLTFSSHDRANCTWHRAVEGEQGIGCSGAAEPAKFVSTFPLAGLNYCYTPQDFATRIVNVNATSAFTKKKLIEGAHSDFWYEESVHLVLSLADFVHGPIRSSQASLGD